MGERKKEFSLILAFKEFSLNTWDDREVKCGGDEYRAGLVGRKIRSDVLDILSSR